jgi:hypothetical protein
VPFLRLVELDERVLTAYRREREAWQVIGTDG